MEKYTRWRGGLEVPSEFCHLPCSVNNTLIKKGSGMVTNFSEFPMLFIKSVFTHLISFFRPQWLAHGIFSVTRAQNCDPCSRSSESSSLNHGSPPKLFLCLSRLANAQTLSLFSSLFNIMYIWNLHWGKENMCLSVRLIFFFFPQQNWMFFHSDISLILLQGKEMSWLKVEKMTVAYCGNIFISCQIKSIKDVKVIL